ncbi:MAG TPA: hypothetical protein VGM84_11370 [Steroidobacteraceae bacterium]|jgi:hypothetical protein
MSENHLRPARCRATFATIVFHVWIAALATGPVAAAETPGDGLETLKKARACTVESDQTKRLACYDRELGKSNAPAADFGLNADVVRRAQAEAGVKAPAAASQIRGKVAAVRADPYGRVIVTLDDGQVWQQQDFNREFPVHVGDEIGFKTGALGALWMLDAHDRMQTRVQRLK